MATAQMALLQVVDEEFQECQKLGDANFAAPLIKNMSDLFVVKKNRRRGRDGSFLKSNTEEEDDVDKLEFPLLLEEGSFGDPHPSLQVYKQHKAFHSGEEFFLPGVYVICSFVQLSAGRTRFRSTTVNDMQVTESPFVISCRMLQQGGKILSQSSSPAGMSSGMSAREQCVFHSLIIEIFVKAKRR